jgi:hypothetical protein
LRATAALIAAACGSGRDIRWTGPVFVALRPVVNRSARPTGTAPVPDSAARLGASPCREFLPVLATSRITPISASGGVADQRRWVRSLAANGRHVPPRYESGQISRFHNTDAKRGAGRGSLAPELVAFAAQFVTIACNGLQYAGRGASRTPNCAVPGRLGFLRRRRRERSRGCAPTFNRRHATGCSFRISAGRGESGARWHTARATSRSTKSRSTTLPKQKLGCNERSHRTIRGDGYPWVSLRDTMQSSEKTCDVIDDLAKGAAGVALLDFSSPQAPR